MQIFFTFVRKIANYGREGNFFFTIIKDDQKVDNKNVGLLVALVF